MKASTGAQRLRELHRGPTFVLANAWDRDSAGRLAAIGFQAIGTTSAGVARHLGLRDGEPSREQSLAIAGEIARAVDEPVSADLGNGFGVSPEECAATIRDAIDLGLAGGSIEDSTTEPRDPVYPFDLAVARVRAAAQAIRDSGRDFVLTARAENHLHGNHDLQDTLRRLEAFAAAGADVLFAPCLPDLAAVRAARARISKPLSVIIGYKGCRYTLPELAAAGVNRISVGSALAREPAEQMEAAARRLRDLEALSSAGHGR